MHQDVLLCAKLLIVRGLLSKRYIAGINCKRSILDISYFFDIRNVFLARHRKKVLSEQYVTKRTIFSPPKGVNRPLSIGSSCQFGTSIQPLNRLNSSAVSSYCSSGRWLSTVITMSDARFECGYAKLGTSTCKKCKQKIEKGSMRIAKVTECLVCGNFYF